MEKVAKSLRRYWHLILSWLQAQGTVSSGLVEGLKGIVKLTTRTEPLGRNTAGKPARSKCPARLTLRVVYSHRQISQIE